MLLVVLSLSVHASPIKHVVFFGDSLTSDNNLYPAITYLLNLPKSFTNGNCWSKTLSDYLDKTQVDHQIYALPGGTSRFQTNDLLTSPAFLKTELFKYALDTTQKDREESLIIIWIGFNDYVLQHANITLKNYAEVAERTIFGITDAVTHLIHLGSRNFLIMNLGELSRTPYFLSLNKGEEIENLIKDHNHKLINAMRTLTTKHAVNIRIFDIDAFFEEIKHNKHKYLLTNTTDACKTLTSVCENPDNFFYWDHIHFSRKIHFALANAVKKSLNESWPQHFQAVRTLGNHAPK